MSVILFSLPQELAERNVPTMIDPRAELPMNERQVSMARSDTQNDSYVGNSRCGGRSPEKRSVKRTAMNKPSGITS